MPMPRKKTPELSLPLMCGGTFTLSEETAERGTLVVLHRGLHCPIYATHPRELERLKPEFAGRGVSTVAVSSDEQERGEKTTKGIHADALRVAHGLPLAEARGPYISTSRGKTSIDIEGPPLFSEPGVFMVTPGRTLHYGSAQTMPFVRPHFAELVKTLDGAISRDCPARGEYLGDV